MIKAYFNYSGNRILILCSLDEKMRNICQKFAVKAQVNVDSKIYICENKTLSINPNLNLSFGEQINSKDTNDKEIMVLDDRDKEYTIQFIYNGEKKEIKVNEDENYQSILSQIGKMFNKGKMKLMSIYNGSIITDEDMEKPISQISKSIDIEDKKMNILLEDQDINEINDEPDNNNELVHIKTNINDNGDNGKNDKNSLLVYRNSIESGKFLLKINLILFFQFLLIGVLTSLGLYYDINKIFIKDLKSMLWTFIPIFLFISFVTLFIPCYGKNLYTKCLIFNIITFIPCITIYFFLLSKFIIFKDIFIIICLINMCFVSAIISILLLRKYKGFGYIILYLILSIIYMIIFYLKDEQINGYEITYISITAALFFSYTLIFNNVSRRKFEDDEIIGTIFHFDYIIFIPSSFIFGAVLVISIVIVIIGIICIICTIILIIYSFIMLFESLK